MRPVYLLGALLFDFLFCGCLMLLFCFDYLRYLLCFVLIMLGVVLLSVCLFCGFLCCVFSCLCLCWIYGLFMS